MLHTFFILSSGLGDLIILSSSSFWTANSESYYTPVKLGCSRFLTTSSATNHQVTPFFQDFSIHFLRTILL
ncbi:hypothetical protein BDD12DRAFT_851317 [Trichophaea hybrida]|nr:hypothetical protein BDD12DRAFT_851317 [Trichophaea hybrida]